MALHDDLVLPSATTLSYACGRDHALSVDAIWKSLQSQKDVSLALDGWTSPNKLAITSVMAHYVEQNLALHQVQLTINEVDR